MSNIEKLLGRPGIPDRKKMTDSQLQRAIKKLRRWASIGCNYTALKYWLSRLEEEIEYRERMKALVSSINSQGGEIVTLGALRAERQQFPER